MFLNFVHICYEKFLVRLNSILGKIRKHIKHDYQLLHNSRGHPLHFMLCPLEFCNGVGLLQQRRKDREHGSLPFKQINSFYNYQF